MNKVKLSRKQLYDLVWQEPLNALSKKYTVSDTGLKKICNTMSIPLPKSGYWTRIKLGKTVEKEELPAFDGDQEIELLLREEGDTANYGLKSPLIILQRQIESDPKLTLTISEELVMPDILIKETQQIFKQREHFQRSNSPNRRYPSGDTLNITVSPENLSRALLFMDAFIKLLKARGHNIIVEGRSTSVIVGGEKIEIRLREKNKRVEVNPEAQYSWDRYRTESSGLLCFSLQGRFSHQNKEWVDGKQKIEVMLSQILAKLELESKERKEYQDRLEAAQAKREEEKQIKEELQSRKNKELADFKGLLIKARRLHQANVIRAYIDQVESKAMQEEKMTEELQNWIDWSRKKADWIDPQIEGSDELLSDINKDKLFEESKAGAGSNYSSSDSYGHEGWRFNKSWMR